MVTRRGLLLGGLVLVALAQIASSASPGENVIEEELTDEQVDYYREIFRQYDEDADQKISMEENLAQDKIIADEQKKPFDEVFPRPPCSVYAAVPFMAPFILKHSPCPSLRC